MTPKRGPRRDHPYKSTQPKWSFTYSDSASEGGQLDLIIKSRKKTSAIASYSLTGNGITESDFVNSLLTGEIKIKNRKSITQSFYLSEDSLTEGSETLSIGLTINGRTYSINNIIIDDTSKSTETTQPPTTQPPTPPQDEDCIKVLTDLNGLYSETTSNANKLEKSIAQDIINGYIYSSVFLGTSGDDSIKGSAENDIIIGGEGDDRLEGGAGADIFYIRKESSSLLLKNIILDFNPQEGDLILLDQDLFDNVTGLRSGIGSVNNATKRNAIKRMPRRAGDFPALAEDGTNDGWITIFIQDSPLQTDFEINSGIANIKTGTLSADSIQLLC